MKGNVSFILELFLRLLKESDRGFGVTVGGGLIFNHRITDEKLIIKKEDLIGAYDEI